MPLPRRPALLRTAAKSLFGVAVFGSTVAAWGFASKLWLMHQPLPGAGGRQGECVLWFVGSSSIHKWTTLARDMANWPTHNRGVNGATLDEIGQRFRNEDKVAAPEAIVFYAGENDIADGRSAQSTAAAMQALLDTRAAKFPHTPAFIVGMKPSPTRWSFRPEQRKLDALMRAEARRHPNTFFLDVSETLLVDGRPGPFYVGDGVHLNRDGYRRWGQKIRAAFEAAMPADRVAACLAKSA